MFKKSLGVAMLLGGLAAAGCSEQNQPKLKYTPETFLQTEVLTSGRLRVENFDTFLAVSATGQVGKAGELALIGRVHPATAVLLDDLTTWYPADRVQPAGCEQIDSLGEFESCVLDLRELDGHNRTHRFWARSYLELLGADLSTYDVSPTPTDSPEECPIYPNPSPVERPPWPDPSPSSSPTPTASPDPGPSPTVTPTPQTEYSATCPCTRTHLAQGKVYDHKNPETWFEYKNAANGQIKWSKGGGEVGGGFESTGKTVFQPWTMETVTCNGYFRDAGNMDRVWLSPCRLWGGPCKDCGDLSSVAPYVTGALTKLFTFNTTTGAFVVNEFPNPCVADGAAIGAPVTW